MDLLPECRAQAPRHSVHRGVLGPWVPVFCANCGAEGGRVPEENMTFCFYLCTPCAETHGQIAGTMLMPDEVFFQKVAEAQLETHGRFLTEAEWAVLDATHPLMKLVRDHPKGG